MKFRLVENYFNIFDFDIGDKVRILMQNKAEYAGHIVNLTDSFIELDIEDYNKNTPTSFVAIKNISKIKKIPEDQDLNSELYFDNDEKEFWRTHIYSKNGLVDRHSIGMPYLDEAAILEERKKRKKDPTKVAMGWHQAFTGFYRDPAKSMEIFNHNMTYNDTFDSKISAPTSNSSETSSSEAGSNSGGDAGGAE